MSRCNDCGEMKEYNKLYFGLQKVKPKRIVPDEETLKKMKELKL